VDLCECYILSRSIDIKFYFCIFKILEGIATVLVGVLAAFVLVDFPATAKFLTPEEKSYLIWKKSQIS
jgi:hypothetical protein